MFKQSLILSLLVLAGCTGVSSDSSKKSAAIDFNYKIENGANIGLVQTFEMEGNTTIQFRNIDSKNLEFIDSKNNEIPFKIVGQYAVLTGVHSDFLAIVNSTAAQITRKDKKSAPAQQSPSEPAIVKKNEITVASVTPPVSASDAYLRAEIVRMQNELLEIKKLLAAAADKSSKPATTPNHQEPSSSLPADMVIVNFRNNSTDFEISPTNKPILINRARMASSIKVKGYTDSNVSNQKAEQIAKNRANSAKAFLVKNGINNSKITVSYEAAGSFVANNVTKSGKEANRRVEIALM